MRKIYIAVTMNLNLPINVILLNITTKVKFFCSINLVLELTLVYL